jgi:hypothetical protein
MEMAFKYLKDAEVVDGATTGKVMSSSFLKNQTNLWAEGCHCSIEHQKQCVKSVKKNHFCFQFAKYISE